VVAEDRCEGLHVYNSEPVDFLIIIRNRREDKHISYALVWKEAQYPYVIARDMSAPSKVTISYAAIASRGDPLRLFFPRQRLIIH
jgi:hypothetical protein